MGAMECVATGKQQFGEPLVEAVEGDFLDELHQLGDALSKQLKDEVPEGAAAGEQLVEQKDRQKQ
ncbi:MAG: hypothetical protein AW07_00156 [Candidatus Accumulibacter sp. SK-11]|nr:MAG: hypothetical protein AW07_00156 [Candidatus Accumulibacter sp. SK-11]